MAKKLKDSLKLVKTTKEIIYLDLEEIKKKKIFLI